MTEVLPGVTPGFARLARQLCQYIRNTAQVPLRVDDFDDDWCPAGETYRAELVSGGLIEQREAVEELEEPGGIYLTAKGEDLANG